MRIVQIYWNITTGWVWDLSSTGWAVVMRRECKKMMFPEMQDEAIDWENSWRSKVSGCRLEGLLIPREFCSGFGFTFKRKFIFKRQRTLQLTEFLCESMSSMQSKHFQCFLSKVWQGRVACRKESITSVPFQLRSLPMSPPVPYESHVCYHC